jgi:carboxymethylenebutenolidase
VRAGEEAMEVEMTISNGNAAPIGSQAPLPVTRGETFVSGGRSIAVEIAMPSAAGEVPLVMILHGTFGMLPQYRAGILSFAEALSNAGIAAAIPHYLDATGTAPGLAVLAEIGEKHLLWRKACAEILARLAADARFDSSRTGLLGFSLGGQLALGLAMDPPPGATVRAVVDFFGPTQLLDPHWSRLPPTLIFHGAADALVPPAESARLASGLDAAGRTKGVDYFHEVYPGQGHGFSGAALTRSRDRTREFLQTILLDRAVSSTGG